MGIERSTVAVCCMFCIYGTCAATAFVGSYFSKPISGYQTDLNGDKRSDIVLKDRSGYRHIFMQEEDGTFKSLDKFVEEHGLREKEMIQKRAESVK